MFEFTDQTRIALTKAGWYPERNINIEQYRRSSFEGNYPFFPKVEQFLHEFGGLDIHFHLRNGMEDSLHFDVTKAIYDVDVLWVQSDYYNRLGSKALCVIGQAFTDLLTLMMDKEGCVYGGFDDYLCFVANSGDEAIDAICANMVFEKII